MKKIPLPTPPKPLTSPNKSFPFGAKVPPRPFSAGGGVSNSDLGKLGRNLAKAKAVK